MDPFSVAPLVVMEGRIGVVVKATVEETEAPGVWQLTDLSSSLASFYTGWGRRR